MFSRFLNFTIGTKSHKASFGWIEKEECHITKVSHLPLETKKPLELSPVERFQSSHGPQVRDALLVLVRDWFRFPPQVGNKCVEISIKDTKRRWHICPDLTVKIQGIKPLMTYYE